MDGHAQQSVRIIDQCTCTADSSPAAVMSGNSKCDCTVLTPSAYCDDQPCGNSPPIIITSNLSVKRRARNHSHSQQPTAMATATATAPADCVCTFSYRFHSHRRVSHTRSVILHTAIDCLLREKVHVINRPPKTVRGRGKLVESE